MANDPSAAMVQTIREDFGGDIGAYLAFLRKAPARRVQQAKEAARSERQVRANLRRALWHRWRQMWLRCTDPEHLAFHNYGGRGITICERWKTFAAYAEDVGMPPGPGLTVDRRDNDGNYEPGNIRWATPTEQSANRRCTKRG